MADCCPLIYVLHTMALQRLVDLNRQIKSLEYMQQSNDNFVRFKLLDDAGSSLSHKRSRKWNKHITAVKQEAADLTGFIMSYLSLLINEQLPVYSSNAGTCLDTCNQAMHESDKWVLDVCSVNEKSLPASIWWIICRNIDIWSIHASKKKLKMFLEHAILTSLPSITKGCTEVERHHTNEAGILNKISAHEISAELLSDSLLYEHQVRGNFTYNPPASHVNAHIIIQTFSSEAQLLFFIVLKLPLFIVCSQAFGIKVLQFIGEISPTTIWGHRTECVT